MHVGHEPGMLCWGGVGPLCACLAEGNGEKRRRQVFQRATMLLDELHHFGFVPAGMDGRGQNGGSTGVQAPACGGVLDVHDVDGAPAPAQLHSNMFRNPLRLSFPGGIEDTDGCYASGSFSVWRLGIVERDAQLRMRARSQCRPRVHHLCWRQSPLPETGYIA